MFGMRAAEQTLDSKALWARPLLPAALLFLCYVVRPVPHELIWEFPKISGTLVWGPYKKDPSICSRKDNYKATRAMQGFAK